MRLIDADALEYTQQVVYKKGDGDEVWAEWFITATEIDNAPTVDAVQVVRCKDCLWWDECYGLDDNGYCHHGERKDDE